MNTMNTIHTGQQISISIHTPANFIPTKVHKIV